MSTEFPASVVDGVSVASSGHHSSMSSASLASLGSGSGAFEGEVDHEPEDSPDVAAGAHTTKVTLTWNGGSYTTPPVVFASHNRFREGIELVDDTATVDAPAGQDLLYRFSVDGEWQTSSDAPIMQLNGEEYNVITVPEEGASEAVHEQPVPMKKRQSSIHWDNQRAKLVISDDSTTAAAAAVAPSDLQSTPVKSQRPTPAGTPLHGPTASPRFVPIQGVEPPHTPLGDADDDDGGDSGDDADATDDAAGNGVTGSARTKRKNRAHRAKLKQRALFQSPPQLQQNGTSVNGNASVRSPATNGMTLNHSTVATLNALKMEALQRENEWKEAWIAHEIQSFRQREDERAELKNQMNEERARWLGKLKEYTADLRAVREENLKLKQDLASAGSQKRLENSSKARAEKFQTLQKNMVAEEMVQWMKERTQLQQEIEKERHAGVELQKQIDSLQEQLTQQTHAHNTLRDDLEARQREVTVGQSEIATLKAQLSAASQGGDKIQQEVYSLQTQLADEVRHRSQLESTVASLTSQSTQARDDLASKQKEVESLKAQASSAAASHSQKEHDLQEEIRKGQEKFLQSQEELFRLRSALEETQFACETAESNLKDAEDLRKVERDEYAAQLALARQSQAETGDKVLALHRVTRDLRQQLKELSETVVENSAVVQKQMADSQTFLTQALGVQAQLLQSTMARYKKEMTLRRKLHNELQEVRGNIRVYARARPMTEEELKTSSQAVTIPPSDEAGEVATELLLESSKGKVTPFQFDAVFGPESTQQDVFAQIVSLVTSVLDGYNVCLMAYGQTGAGKLQSEQRVNLVCRIRQCHIDDSQLSFPCLLFFSLSR